MNQKRRQLATKFSWRTTGQRADVNWSVRFFAATLLLVIVPLLSFPVLAQTRIVQAIPTKSFGYLPLFVAQENGFYNDESLEVISPVVRSAAALPGRCLERSILRRLSLECGSP